MKIDDFPLSRVPKSSRVSFLSVAIVHMGMLTALDQFMLGAVLGGQMDLTHAWISIIFGSLIFGIITFGIGYIGMKEGLSGTLLSRWCGFGKLGSALIGIVVAVSLLGWFGIQNAIFAKSLSAALNGVIGYKMAAALSGMTLTIIVAFGFKALRWTARIAVPAFVILIAWISWNTLAGDSVQPVTDVPPVEMLTINTGITLVIGGAILASLMTPDLTRYSKNGMHVFGITLLTIILGEFIINGLAIFIAQKIGTSDIMTIITVSTGSLGLLAVVCSTLRVNDLNLYSSSLGIINSIESIFGFKASYSKVALVIGALGTTLSILGILDHFVDFLNVLGVTIPPILSVILTEYYISKKYAKLLSRHRDEDILAHTPMNNGWPAIIACIIGTTIGFFISYGVPVINSILAAGISYLVLTHLTQVESRQVNPMR